ncbi:uncharacterized protein RSE6_14410 [Rhynchosporium secalis]|uniref:RRM domain-containing protein n=1 Tax=Rhynchosporium secalis TaxID=38038 RepID=A0A1E1MVV1_RHYSE|nr:uncharacterized protein RSE6_14410 [Rhynchosporium secalis]
MQAGQSDFDDTSKPFTKKPTETPKLFQVLCSNIMRYTSLQQNSALFLEKFSFHGINKLFPEKIMRAGEERYCTYLSFSNLIGARIAVAKKNGSIVNGSPLKLEDDVKPQVQQKRPFETYEGKCDEADRKSKRVMTRRSKGGWFELRGKKDRPETFGVYAFETKLTATIDKIPHLDHLEIIGMMYEGTFAWGERHLEKIEYHRQYITTLETSHGRENLLFPAPEDDKTLPCHRTLLLSAMSKLKERYSELQLFDALFNQYLHCPKSEQHRVPLALRGIRNKTEHEDEGIFAWMIDWHEVLDFAHVEVDRLKWAWKVAKAKSRARLANVKQVQNRNTSKR